MRKKTTESVQWCSWLKCYSVVMLDKLNLVFYKNVNEKIGAKNFLKSFGIFGLNIALRFHDLTLFLDLGSVLDRN